MRFAPLFLGVLWACDSSGPTVTEIRVTPGNFTLQSLGEGIQFTAQVLDAEGTAITGIQVTWSSSNPDVVSISATGQATAQAPGSSQIQASAEGVTGSAGLVVSQVPAELRKVSGDVQTQTVNRPLETDPEVEVRDARGNPIPDVTVDFSVLSGGGSVDPSIRTTDSQGRVTTRWTLGPSASEEQRLQALAIQVATVFSAQAQADKASMLALASGDGQQGPPGSTLPEPLTVRVMDTFENGVAGVEVTFTTTAGSLAPTSVVSGDDGTVSTLLTLPDEETPVLVEAASPGLGSVQFTLSSADLALSVVTLALPQGRATLEYTPGELQAEGGAGGEYTWLVASGVLPPGMELTLAGLLLGTPSVAGEFPFRAQVTDALGNTAHKDLTLEVCAAPIALERGEHWIGTPAAPGQCGLFIPSGGNHRYRVALIRPAESVAKADVVTARVQVTGVGGISGSPVAPAMSFQDYAGYGDLGGDARAGVASRMDPHALAVHEATAREHARLRESERVMFQDLIARYGRDLQALPDLQNQRRGAQSVGGGTVVGSSTGPQLSSHAPARRVFIPSTECRVTPGPERVGLLVAQNAHLAVYQDSIQRESTPVSQAAVQQMLDFYNAHGKDIIDGYFGGVPDIDGNGQVVVFVSPAVGGNTAAFVWSGDFLSKAQCPDSNEMEITFFSVSTINGIDSGNFQALATLVHELKHVSSLHKRVRRFFGQGDENPFHPAWVEEGTAEIAAEMASRLGWSRNGGPGVTQPIQAASFQGGFNANNYGVALRLATTVNYLSSQPNMVTADPVGPPSNHNFYGSSWHFHRFIADAYLGANAVPFPDAAFFQAQNDSLARPGVAGLRDVLLSQAGASRTFEDLIAEFTVGIMLTGTTAPAPQRRFRTYIFPSATEIFTNPDPPGAYPWPVTVTGVDEREGQNRQPAPSHVGFQTAEYAGPIAPTGIRIHEFLSNGSGLGMEVHVPRIPSTALRLVVVRIF